MAKKIGILNILQNLFCGDMTDDYKKDAEKFIEKNLGEDYGEYLEKPKEHHDTVIKRMYSNTKYANESPDRLREILREQVTGEKALLH